MKRSLLITAAALMLAAVVFVVAVAPRVSAQAGPARWEYLSVMVVNDLSTNLFTVVVNQAPHPTSNDVNIADVLNTYGADGWELVTHQYSVDVSARAVGNLFYFKRPLQ